MKTLYRLKSNQNTIVEKERMFARVFWTEGMEKGCSDDSWMRFMWQEENAEILNEDESALLMKKKEEYSIKRA